jgi:hypothetical protein
MFIFNVLFLAILCFTVNSLSENGMFDKDIQEATQVYASQLNSTLLSRLASDHLQGLSLEQQSYFLTTLKSTLTQSFHEKLTLELYSQDLESENEDQRLWASVKNGMRTDLNQFLGLEKSPQSVNSLQTPNLLKRSIFSKEFKSGLKKDWHRLGLNLERIARVAYYTCIYSPFLTLKYYFQLWMFYIKRRWTQFQNKRAFEKVQKSLRPPKRRLSFGGEVYRDFPVLRDFAAKHL